MGTTVPQKIKYASVLTLYKKYVCSIVYTGIINADFHRATRRYVPGDRALHNLKSSMNSSAKGQHCRDDCEHLALVIQVCGRSKICKARDVVPIIFNPFNRTLSAVYIIQPLMGGSL